MLPAMAIAKGTTHSTLNKFVKDMPGRFNGRGGGAKRSDSKKVTSRYTRIDGDANKPLATLPPYYLDEKTGYLLCAGDGSHWMNESTLRLWIILVVWAAHKKACEAEGIDHMDSYSILHFDAYPVHIAKGFREWLHDNYPQILLVYVPASCTSVMQFADVVLNRPLKAAFTRKHTDFLIGYYRRQMIDGIMPSDVAFSDVVSKSAGRALSWLMTAYADLEKLNMQKGFERIGYTKCFSDLNFRFKAAKAWDELFNSEPPNEDELKAMGIHMGILSMEDELLDEIAVLESDPNGNMHYE